MSDQAQERAEALKNAKAILSNDYESSSYADDLHNLASALLTKNERLKDENELLREVVSSMPTSYIVAWSDESRNALMALAALPALIALAPLARDAADTEGQS